MLRANVFSFQRALANQPWKEYTAEGGRKYWSHTETKQSTWEMPEVYKTALAQAQHPHAPAAASAYVFVFDYKVRFPTDFVVANRLSSLADPVPSLHIPSNAIAMTMTGVPPIGVVDIMLWTLTV
jgi:hypothetical protein